MSKPLEFIDLKAQRLRLGARVDDAIQRVLDHGRFILGPEVEELEGMLTEFCGARHTITCANGTDAITMVLMAWGVGVGDAVFVPSFNFVSAAESVALLGATPVFVDVDKRTFNIDIGSLDSAIAAAKGIGLAPKVIVAVDLFGQPANYPCVAEVADEHSLFVLADAAQSYGGRLNGRHVGVHGDATTTSFFPAKPLGCYGDGGAIFTDDDDLADALRSIRVHGKGSDKYDNQRVGLNARLDTFQAAILIEKLKIFEEELVARQKVADRYNEGLGVAVQVPFVLNEAKSAWAQYTLIVDDRVKLMSACKSQGIPTQVYYPVPLHKQTAYSNMPCASDGCLTSSRLSEQVVSLPIHPYLNIADQDRIIEAVAAELT